MHRASTNLVMHNEHTLFCESWMEEIVPIFYLVDSSALLGFYSLLFCRYWLNVLSEHLPDLVDKVELDYRISFLCISGSFTVSQAFSG